MGNTIQSIRGFSDILPAQTPVWRFVEQTFQRALERYGFAEIRLPVIEKTALFSRSIGEVTDIVEKEMYTFDDRNGDSLTLRPEGTAGCVRAALENGLLHNARSKLWYSGPMFRHERPQRGRYRQFHQIGAEVFGYPGPGQDAELILLAGRILRDLGLKGIRLEINDLGTADDRARYRAALIEYFEGHGDALDDDARRRLYSNPLRILDSKNPAMRPIVDKAPDLHDFLGEESTAHFAGLCAMLDAAGQAYVVNRRLVRGLDYYGGTVFEWISDELGAQGTVLAGGRYDVLVEMIGGPATPAIGFAAGLERLVALVEESGRAPQVQPPQAYVVVADPQLEADTLALVERWRDADPGLHIQLHLGGGSMKSQLRRADRSGAALALIRGQAEAEAGEVLVKDLRGEAQQYALALDQVPTLLCELINR